MTSLLLVWGPHFEEQSRGSAETSALTSGKCHTGGHLEDKHKAGKNMMQIFSTMREVQCSSMVRVSKREKPHLVQEERLHGRSGIFKML